MGLRVIWSLIAREQLQDVYKYLRKWNGVKARGKVKELKKETDILSDFPRIGKRLSDLPDRNIRVLLLGNYRIIYELFSDYVSILRVYPTSYSNYENNLRL